MKIDQFVGTTPTFVLEDFFVGEIWGWGITMARIGGIQNRFRIRATGEWDVSSSTLSLTERYEFDDGHTDILEWQILKAGGRYIGNESRIEDTADGEQAGNAFCWKYIRDVPSKDGSSTRYGFEDWFFLHDEATMTAHASITKLGIEVATLQAFYQKTHV